MILLLISTKTYSQTQITVSNSVDFIKNLKSNSILKLKAGTYYVSPNDSILLGINEHYKISTENWWFPVLIENLENVKIIGLGKVNIISKDPRYYVLPFKNCHNLYIENITVGHDVKEECSGGTMYVQESTNINLTKLNIYGSGVIGLDVKDVDNLTVTDTKIYDCSNYIISIYRSKHIIFRNTIFENSKLNKVMYFNELNEISFENCIVRNNIGKEPLTESSILVYNEDMKSDIIFKNTLFENNISFENFTNDNEKFNVKKCKFRKNNFQYPPKKESEFTEGGIMEIK